MVLSLKGKFGEKPTRSRHCKWEQPIICHCLIGWEDIGSDDHEPGNLPNSCTPINLRG